MGSACVHCELPCTKDDASKLDDPCKVASWEDTRLMPDQSDAEGTVGQPVLTERVYPQCLFSQSGESWLQERIRNRISERGRRRKCVSPSCSFFECKEMGNGFCCYACLYFGTHGDVCMQEPYTEPTHVAERDAVELEDSNQCGADGAQDELTIQLATEAAAAGQHMLSERLFAEVCGRGMNDTLKMKLEWKCDFLRDIVELWQSRDQPGWKILEEPNASSLCQSRLLRDANSSHVAIQFESVIDMPVFCAAALLHEVDLMLNWLPWFTAVEEVHNCIPDESGSGNHFQKILRAEVQFPRPISLTLEFLIYGFGSTMFEEHGVFVAGGRSLWTDNFWGYSLSWPPRKMRLNFLNFGFILQPVDGFAKTRIVLVARLHAPEPPNVPEWVTARLQAFIVKQYARLFFRRVENVRQNFWASEYGSRVQTKEVYSHIECALNAYKLKCHPSGSVPPLVENVDHAAAAELAQSTHACERYKAEDASGWKQRGGCWQFCGSTVHNLCRGRS